MLPRYLGLLHFLKASPLFALGEIVHEALWFRRCVKRGSFSQHGEDTFILEFYGRRRQGTYLDVGASHPFKISNTYLLYRMGWRGVTVEPIPRLWRKHRLWRAEDVQLNCGVGATSGALTFFELTPGVESTFNQDLAETRIKTGHARLVRRYNVQVVTLNDICEQYFSDRDLDLLSVDTEGCDLQVLRGMEWSSFRPSLVVVETANVLAASSANELRDFLQAQSYQFIRACGCNSFFRPLQ